MKTRLIIAALGATALLSGCGSVNQLLAEQTETTEYLRIFDIKTTANVKQVGQALQAGMSKNLEDPKIERSLMVNSIPETPGRFTTDDALQNSNFSRLVQMTGGSLAQFRVMKCDGAPWKGMGTRSSSTGDWDGRVTVCLFPYKGGYHVDMYGYMAVKKGGIKELVRGSVYSVMGNPVEWMEKSLLDTVRTVRQDLGAEVTLVEADPEIEGTPWLLDDGIDIQKQ